MGTKIGQNTKEDSRKGHIYKVRKAITEDIEMYGWIITDTMLRYDGDIENYNLIMEKRNQIETLEEVKNFKITLNQALSMMMMTEEIIIVLQKYAKSVGDNEIKEAGELLLKYAEEAIEELEIKVKCERHGV